MKTMTCRQLGGPCDLELRGSHPIASMGWYRDAKRAFAELPEE